MNGALRFFAIAFLLALCYHWLGEDEWSDVEEDVQDSREDLIAKFSQSLHRKSGERLMKGDNGNLKASDLEDLQTSIYFFHINLNISCNNSFIRATST